MKKCFKCSVLKPREQFYKHSGMEDGRLGKCKECAKADVASNIEIKKKDPQWVKAERARCRKKQERYRKLGLKKVYPGNAKKWRQLNPVKYKAHAKASYAERVGIIAKKDSCEACGINGVRLEKHHEDYSKPLDVVFLCSKCHGLTRRKDSKPQPNANVLISSSRQIHSTF